MRNKVFHHVLTSPPSCCTQNIVTLKGISKTRVLPREPPRSHGLYSWGKRITDDDDGGDNDDDDGGDNSGEQLGNNLEANLDEIMHTWTSSPVFVSTREVGGTAVFIQHLSDVGRDGVDGGNGVHGGDGDGHDGGNGDGHDSGNGENVLSTFTSKMLRALAPVPAVMESPKEAIKPMSIGRSWWTLRWVGGCPS